MNKKIFLLSICLLLAFFLRFYRVSETTIFSFDEARDVINARQIILGKLTLLGPETKLGNKLIYFGPFNYYLIAPSLLALNFDPVGPQLFTILLGTATTLAIYLFEKNLWSSFFYAVFPVAVFYNRWAWYPNTIPFFAALFYLGIFSQRFFWAGLAAGLAIEQHISASALVAVTTIYFFLKRKDLKPGTLAYLGAGLFLGLLPMIIFDLRHNFLYFQSYLGAIFASNVNRGFNFHYFLWLIPHLAIWFAKFPKKIKIALLFASAYVSFSWISSLPKTFATNPKTIKTISQIIVLDQMTTPDLTFNVASFVDPDARASGYRYFLELFGVSPLSVEKFDVADHLYVITFDDPVKVLYNSTYEIASFKPKRISRTWKVGDENIYRLERI